MRVSRNWASLAALSLTLMGACANDDGESDTSCPEGTVLTSEGDCAPETIVFSPDAVTSQMSTQELQAFCEHVRDSLMEINAKSQMSQADCIGQGLGARFGGDGEVATCEAARDSCLESLGPDDRPEEEALSCAGGAFGLGSCDMTVAEFEACTTAIFDRISEIEDTLNCSISQEDAAQLEANNSDASPEECGPAEAACPNLWGPGPSGP